MFELVRPRHLAKCQHKLPENPRGSLGVFAVTFPIGTVQVDADAFTAPGEWRPSYKDTVRPNDKDDAATTSMRAAGPGLAQITLLATASVIEAGGISHGSDNDTSDDDDDEGEGEGYGTFSGCSSLRKITLPPNLTEIGRSAFRGCTSLSEITLPAGPVVIGSRAFGACPGTPQQLLAPPS